MRSGRCLLTPALRLASALTLAAAAACSTEPTTTGSEAPAPPDDVAAHAFQLTIDVATGQVTVRDPRSESRAAASGSGGPSLSLPGNEAVALHAGNCNPPARRSILRARLEPCRPNS